MTKSAARILVPLAIVASTALGANAIASAAPTDVTLGATSTGSEVTLSFVNKSPLGLACDFRAVPASGTFDSPAAFVGRAGVYPDYTDVQKLTSIADGTYSIYWSCLGYVPNEPSSESWGTNPPAGEGDPVQYAVTALPTHLVVDSTAPVPGPCLGPICLPAGFPGFGS